MTKSRTSVIKAMFSTLAGRLADKKVTGQRNIIDFNLPDPESEGWSSFDEVKRVARNEPKAPTPMNPYLAFLFAFFFSALFLYVQNAGLLIDANDQVQHFADRVLQAVPSIDYKSLAYLLVVAVAFFPAVAVYHLVVARTFSSISLLSIIMMTLGLSAVWMCSMTKLNGSEFTLLDYLCLQVAGLMGFYWKHGDYTHVVSWSVLMILTYPVGYYHARLRRVTNPDYSEQERKHIDANFFYKTYIEAYERWFEVNKVAQGHYDVIKEEEAYLSKLINRIVKSNEIEVLESALASRDGNTFWTAADHLVKEFKSGLQMVKIQTEEYGNFHKYVLGRESSFAVVDARHALLFNKALEPQMQKLMSYLDSAMANRDMFLELERLNREIVVEYDHDMFKQVIKEITSDSADVLTVLQTHIDDEGERTAYSVGGEGYSNKDEVEQLTKRVDEHLNWATV